MASAVYFKKYVVVAANLAIKTVRFGGSVPTPRKEPRDVYLCATGKAPIRGVQGKAGR